MKTSLNRKLAIFRGAEDLVEAVSNHLGILLNARSYLAPSDLADFPALEDSVLNYGYRDFCGINVREFGDQEMVGSVVEAIIRFEPRINSQTLAVTKLPERSTSDAVRFQIQAEIWATPASGGFAWTVELDIGTGRVSFDQGMQGQGEVSE